MPLKDVTTTEGQTVTLECEVSKPNQQVAWFKNGKKITKPDKNMKIERDGTVHRLTMTNATPTDAAEFSATVANDKTVGNVKVEGASAWLQ